MAYAYTSDLARELGIHPNTVHKYRRQMEESGRYPEAVIGCHNWVLISREDFLAYLAEHRRKEIAEKEEKQ